MKEVPSWEEFYGYFSERMRKCGDDPKNYTEWLDAKYEAWKLNGWKKEKNGKLIPIKNWKSTLLQCEPHRVPNKVKRVVTDPSRKKTLTKMDNIEIDEILFAFSEFKEKKALIPPHQKCYDYLLKKKVFQKGNVISKKTGKPWQDWYNSLTKNALTFAVAYAMDKDLPIKERNEIRKGNHSLCVDFVKIEAVKTYFSRFNDRNQLKSVLLAL